MGDAEVIRMLRDTAEQQALLIRRVEMLEAATLQIAADLCLFAGTENAILKFALLKANMNTSRMRKDLEETWKRWKEVLDRAAINAKSAPTEVKQ